jgi:hypothetical protein
MMPRLTVSLVSVGDTEVLMLDKYDASSHSLPGLRLRMAPLCPILPSSASDLARLPLCLCLGEADVLRREEGTLASVSLLLGLGLQRHSLATLHPPGRLQRRRGRYLLLLSWGYFQFCPNIVRDKCTT